MPIKNFHQANLQEKCQFLLNQVLAQKDLVSVVKYGWQLPVVLCLVLP